MLNLNLLFFVPLVLAALLHNRIFGIYYYYYDLFASHFESSDNIFDFIVVGGGSAGAVVATRLAQHNKVLLLEAGGDPLPLQSIPAFAGLFASSKYVDWNHKTVPQQYSQYGQITENVSTWPAGKSLGGSSSLNYMFYVRAHPKDYDHWADITGDPSWKYDNLLQFFKKSLQHYNGKYKENVKHYGNGYQTYGINVDNKYYEEKPLWPFVLEAGKEFRIQHIGDLNGPQKEGIGGLEMSLKNGARSGTFAGYLKPAQELSNLVISRYSFATKIKLDEHNQAEGVWYVRHGRKRYARALKEVVVSAGTVNSPKLLMLSGIGPKEHLRGVKIRPRIDLPVGKNLKDHLMLMLPNVILENVEKSWVSFPENDWNPISMYDYLIHGKGPFATSQPVVAQGFVSTSKVNKSIESPNIQLYFVGAGIFNGFDAAFSSIMGLKLKFFEKLVAKHTGQVSLLPAVVLVKSKSTGSVLLRNKDPEAPALINPNYYADSRDIESTVEACQLFQKFLEETKSFKKLKAQMFREPLPGCEAHKLFSKKYWECYARHMAATMFHPTGTCRMGKIHDSEAVVDPFLRVRHSRRLRVVDASIIPEMLNGNTNAAVIMVGEKASYFIREYWSEQYSVCPLLNYYPNNNFQPKCFYSRLV